MSQHDHLGAAISKLVQCRQRRANPSVVGDRFTVERNVEVTADQHPLAAELTKIRNRLHGGSFPEQDGRVDVDVPALHRLLTLCTRCATRAQRRYPTQRGIPTGAWRSRET